MVLLYDVVAHSLPVYLVHCLKVKAGKWEKPPVVLSKGVNLGQSETICGEFVLRFTGGGGHFL